jgi:hypothetical protein
LSLRTGDCTPRLPAVRLEVKKEAPTKGRFFYSCQKSRQAQCGFFLWEDKAKPREQAALLNNSRSENVTSPATPRRRNPYEPAPFRGIDSLRKGTGSSSEEEASGDEPDAQTPSRQKKRASPRTSARLAASGKQTGRSISPAPSQRSGSVRTADNGDGRSRASSVATAATTMTTTTPNMGRSRKQVAFASPITTPSAKRKRDAFEDDEDDEDDDAFDDVDSDTERQLVQLAAQTESSSQRQTQNQTQPLTSERPSFETPQAQRSHDATSGGLPTPVSRNSLLLSAEQRDAKRIKAESNKSSATAGRPTGASTSEVAGSPTPTRAMDDVASSPSKSLDGEEMTREIMGLLEDQRLDGNARRRVRSALAKYSLLISGVTRGRDMARSVLKSRDARIAQLQEQVIQLQAQRTVDRLKIQEMKAKGLAIYQQDE